MRSKMLLTIILSVLVCVGFYNHSKQQYKKGLHEGRVNAEREYEEIMKELKIKALERERELNDKINTLTLNHRNKQIEMQQEYEKEKRRLENDKETILAHYRNNINRLSIEVHHARNQCTGAHASTDSHDTGHTVTRATLSERSAGFLVGQASIADETLNQLNLCKAVLKDTYRIVDEYNKTIKKK